MGQGIQCFDAVTGAVTFDSANENVLFFIDEFDITGAMVGNQGGVTYSFPEYSGKKIVAFMQSPIGEGTIEMMAVLSCRVSGTDVSVFVDFQDSNLPNCDGHLMVFYTGGSA